MLKFTEEHEWLKIEGGVATVGITTHAAEQLGDLVFVELPEVGAHYAKDKEIAVVESVKAASDVYAPVAGTITAVNSDLVSSPEAVNQDAYAAWLFKMKPAKAADLDTLLDAATYTSVSME